jgi:hypothetical protein
MKEIMRNNYRYDLSDRLIHFFRPLSVDDDSAPDLPKSWGFTNIAEEEKYPSLFLLRCAIRHCRLWATWSYRNGSRTIYGPYPATCFTEMPIAAFIEASKNRAAKKEKISIYALIFKKIEMYKLGARPVIYGLSGKSSPPVHYNGWERIIDPKYLPLREQYRYVAFNPLSLIDWTHEREWRLPYYEDISNYLRDLEIFGFVSEVKDIPSFQIKSALFSEIGVIVNKKVELPLIIHDILSLIDRSVIDKDTYTYIICNELINDVILLRDPEKEKELINKSIIDIADYFVVNKERDLTYLRMIKDIEKSIEDSAGDIESGEFGRCWLWIYDIQHPFTRALINQNEIIVNQTGRYLYFPSYFSDARSLRQKKEMVNKFAILVKEKLDVECGYFAVLNSDNPDEVPFYNDDVLDNYFLYNCAYHEF